MANREKFISKFNSKNKTDKQSRRDHSKSFKQRDQFIKRQRSCKRMFEEGEA